MNHSLKNQTTGQTIIQKLKLADGFWARFRGLMLTEPMQANEAILISQCKQVHTHFMNYAIDIYYLDKQMKVLDKLPNVQPWGFTRYYKEAYYVLETMPNAIQSINIGDSLLINHS